MNFIPVIAMVFFSMSALAAEEPYRVPIYVSTNCNNDSVGERLGFRFREAVRKSQLMTLAAAPEAVISIGFVCLDPTPEERGKVSKFAYVITHLNPDGYYDYHLASGVGPCASAEVDECANLFLFTVHKLIVDVKRRMEDGSFDP